MPGHELIARLYALFNLLEPRSDDLRRWGGDLGPETTAVGRKCSHSIGPTAVPMRLEPQTYFARMPQTRALTCSATLPVTMPTPRRSSARLLPGRWGSEPSETDGLAG